MADGQPRPRRPPDRRREQLRHLPRRLQHEAHPGRARRDDGDDRDLHDRPAVRDAAGAGRTASPSRPPALLPGGQRQPRGRRPERGRDRLQGLRVQALERRAGRRAPAGRARRSSPSTAPGEHRLEPHDHPDRGRGEPSPRPARNGGRARQRGGRRQRGRLPLRRPHEPRVAGDQGGQRRHRPRRRPRRARRRANQFTVRYNLIHDVGGNGVDVYQAPNANLLLANNIIHTTGGHGVYLDPAVLVGLGRSGSSTTPCRTPAAARWRCFKGAAASGATRRTYSSPTTSATTWRGAADDFDFPDNDPANGWADVDAAEPRNLSSDSSATRHNIIPGGARLRRHRQLRELRRRANSTSTPPATHRRRAPICPRLMPALDIDGQSRPAGAAWDIGADEYGATTAVTLMSFDGACRRTGRWISCGGRAPRWTISASTSTAALSADGPWTRLTSIADPRARASRPMGASYAWRD